MLKEIKKYLRHLRANGFALLTLKKYQITLNYLAAWLKRNGISRFRSVSVADAEKYMNDVSQLECSADTRKRYLIHSRKFFSWLVNESELLHNPFDGLKMPRVPQKLPATLLEEDDIRNILTSVNIGSETGQRDRAILETFFATGIRRMELLNLKASDINMEKRTLFIRDGKGKKDRIIPISRRALYWIKRYRKIRLPAKYLFTNSEGGKLSASNLTNRIKQYAKQANITKPGVGRGFRHFLATSMLNHGADIRYIQEMLGHKSLNSTQVYTRLNIVRLKEVHRKTHPAASMKIK